MADVELKDRMGRMRAKRAFMLVQAQQRRLDEARAVRLAAWTRMVAAIAVVELVVIRRQGRVCVQRQCRSMTPAPRKYPELTRFLRERNC